MLSGLSYQYINKVRQAKTTRDHLRAYDGIKLLTQEVSFYQQVYNRNSRALGICDPAHRSRYPLLRRSDCTINTAIADVNARGQSQARLSWLWAAQDGWDGEDQPGQNAMLDNDRLLECECSPLVPWFWYLMMTFQFTGLIGCRLGHIPNVGKRNFREPKRRWNGRHGISCMKGMSGTDNW